MSFAPKITAIEKMTIFTFCTILSVLFFCLFDVFTWPIDCVDDNGHKWGKWEIIGRRLLYDNSAVHERTCIKCNFKELE